MSCHVNFHPGVCRLQNNFFMEKNPTIVNFPVKNLELRDIIPLPEGESGDEGPCGFVKQYIDCAIARLKYRWAQIVELLFAL